MGKGHYIGGSTVIGFGCKWSDSADFSERLAQPSAKKKKKVHKKKHLAGIEPELVIPERKANLIVSILKDLGRTPPKKRNRLNNVLRGLIEQGVITQDGTVNPHDPLIEMWLQRTSAKPDPKSPESAILTS